MRELRYRRYFNNEKTEIASETQLVFSPLFLYYKEREMDGDVSEDGGSYGRSSVRAMNQFGICLEMDDAYQPHDFRRVPTDAQLEEALAYRSGAYHRLTTVDDMKSC